MSSFNYKGTCSLSMTMNICEALIGSTNNTGQTSSQIAINNCNQLITKRA